MAESCLYQFSASRFHFANLLKVRYCTIRVYVSEFMPAGNIQHPWEEFYEVSTWISSPGEALDEVIDELDVEVLFGLDGRFIIYDG